jgi:photosystem II PsbY protein
MDWRLLVVLLPLLAAGGWAVYNIGKLALEQFNKMMKERT